MEGNISKGLTDLGNCDLVKREIKLTDKIPVKESPRRIPLALFQEVREHLQEMIDAGVILLQYRHSEKKGWNDPLLC